MASVVRFFQEVKQEARKVSWPARKEALMVTATVLVMTILAAIFFLIVDGLVSWLIRLLLGV